MNPERGADNEKVVDPADCVHTNDFHMTERAKIKANGESYEVEAGSSIESFLAGLGLKLDLVVVEYNGQAHTRKQARSIQLVDGDVLEIIRIVAGG